MQEYRKAFESQQSAHNILKLILPEDSHVLTKSKAQLDMYFAISVRQEKQKSAFTRPIGSNKEVIDPKYAAALVEAQKRGQIARDAAAK